MQPLTYLIYFHNIILSIKADKNSEYHLYLNMKCVNSYLNNHVQVGVSWRNTPKLFTLLTRAYVTILHIHQNAI